MSPQQEELLRRLEAWFDTLTPAEQVVMLRVLDKIVERAKAMEPEAFKVWLDEVWPHVLQLPQLLRHLNS